MEKLKKLKLSHLSGADLEKREMNALVGGTCCACGCQYSGTYASTKDNGVANSREGNTSTGTKPGGTVACYSEPLFIPGMCQDSMS